MTRVRSRVTGPRRAPTRRVRELVQSRRALLLHAANAAAVLAIIVLMVLKPGAS